MSLRDVVIEHGGFCRTRLLLALGATERMLTAAVRSGELVRARNGWYSSREASDPEFRALRVGGRLTGRSAIAALGGWVLHERELHVAVPSNAARLRSQWNRRRRRAPTTRDGAVVHWESRAHDDRGTATIVALDDALVRMILDEPFEEAVAALDWALHEGRIDFGDLAAIAARLPLDLQGIVDWVDAECESLPESLSRTRLRLAGLRVTSQLPLPTRERVDLVVEGAVGFEADGDEYHRHTFERDRRKDLAITMIGLHPLRSSARMIFHEWPIVLAAVLAAINRTTAASLAPDIVGTKARVPDSASPRRVGNSGPGACRRPGRAQLRGAAIPAHGAS